MTPLIGFFVVATVVGATLAGGWVPLRFEKHTRLFLSFSAGTLVALALLELLPEGIEGAKEIHPRLLIVMAAFVVTMLLDKLHVLHPHSHGMEEQCPHDEHEHPPLAIHGAIGLLIHSAVDGMALAASLRQSLGTALAVAVALSTHKLADGMTTVSLVLTHHHKKGQAASLLIGNAASLLAGLALGWLLVLGAEQLAILLLVMAGFFLYLGATDLIPSLTTPVCRKRDVIATALGIGTIAIISLFGH